MEEEINYSTVVFKNAGKAREEKKEDPTIYSEVKPKVAPTTVPLQAEGEAAAGPQFGALVVCLGILSILLVVTISVIIYISVAMTEQKTTLTAANQLMITERTLLKQNTTLLKQEYEEMSKVTNNLNWTLGVILRFNTFPVSDYCPDKKCQPCRSGWIPFQDKCYLFDYRRSPWNTWDQSRRICQKTDLADLVVIDNLQEQEFISNHTRYYYDRFHGYWLGLSRTSDQTWVWVDGRNDTLGYWMDQAGDESRMRCGLMVPGNNLTASWSQAECIMLNRFICESDALIKTSESNV